MDLTMRIQMRERKLSKVSAKQNRTRNNIVLALRRRFARDLARLLAAQRDKVVYLGHIGHDEALLKVRVDDAGGLRRCATHQAC